MSQTITFGEEAANVQVATNRGWMDVVDWADGLENDTYPNLLHLIDHGECDDLAGLIDDIDTAIAHDKPDDRTILKTLRGLRAAVHQYQGEPYVIVSDGFHSGFEDDVEEEESE